MDEADAFLAELVRAPHTLATYRRALDLFAAFAPIPLRDLGATDRAVLTRYVQWLLDARGLAPASVRVYATAVRRWFRWMAVNDLLPPAFPFPKALASLDDALRGGLFRADRRAPEPPGGIERTLTWYDRQPAPPDARADPARLARFAAQTARDRALVRVLYETGGRVSEVLSLRVGDFPPLAFTRDVWRVEVVGKGRHRYKLYFAEALPYVQAYLEVGRRGAPDDAPLFVHHSARYAGTPLSRKSAWAVVDAARRGLALARITPHDYRHHLATRLLNAGVPLDVVQLRLGHRSVETTRAYYAHTDEARVIATVRQSG